MRHFRLRYSIQSQDPIEPRLPDCRYAVIDHHTGDTVERWLTWDEAHDLINELLDEKAQEPEDEYPELSPGWRTRMMVRSGMFGR